MESKETLNINYTTIIKELDRIIVSKTVTDKIGTDYQSESISSISLNEDKTTLFTKMEFSYDENLTHEITLSAILDMDYVINP